MNVNYPNLLVTTGYWDSQVQYWEPAKWVAKIRDYLELMIIYYLCIVIWMRGMEDHQVDLKV